jgi:hypothetical protein
LVKDLGIGKSDYVVNGVSPMQASGFAGSLASLLADTPICFSGSAPNPADVAKIQSATTLFLDGASPVQASQLPAYTLKNLVVVGGTKGDADSIAQDLKAKAKVTAEKVSFLAKS